MGDLNALIPAAGDSNCVNGYGHGNSPAGGNWIYVETIRHSNPSNQYATQRAMDFFSNRTWERRLQNGVWGNWVSTKDDGNLAANYTKLSSGLIFQWGWAGSAGTYCYPIRFPNAVFAVLGQNWSDGKRGLGVYNVNTSCFYGEVGEGGYSTNQGMPFYWMAIGY